MSSYVFMSVDSVRELTQACIGRIDAHNKKALAQAVAEYRQGWWIFKPSAKLSDKDIENRLYLDFKFYESGGYTRDIASNLLKAIEHAAPGSMVQISVDALARLT